MIDLNTKRFCKIGVENGVNLLHGLHDLIQENISSNFIVCEIGSFRGVSASLFAEFCTKLYCVDPWKSYKSNFDNISEFTIEEAEREFDERMSNYKNIVKVKSTSLEACKNFDDHYFDLVYIDGSHAYEDVKNDIINWKSKIKPGGFISGHDFLIKDVNRAIEDTIGFDNIKQYADTSWIKQVNI